jgi:hypothetical protein
VKFDDISTQFPKPRARAKKKMLSDIESPSSLEQGEEEAKT